MEKVREIKKSKLPHTTTVNDNDWSFIKEQLEIIRNKERKPFILRLNKFALVDHKIKNLSVCSKIYF